MSAPTTSAPTLPPPDLSSLCLAIAEHAPLAMATVEGADHIVRFINPAFCRLLDKSRAQLVGKPFSALLPANDVCLSLLDRVYHTGSAESYTEEEPADPNPVFWSFAMWPLLDGEGPSGIMIQVTETAKFHEQMIATNEALLLGSIRQHELTEAAESLNARLKVEIAARQLLENQLRQAQKMEAIGQLTGGIAHDFNNILTVINGHSELLLDRLPPSDPIAQTLHIIRGAGDQAAALTRQLLAFSRQTVLEPKVLDLNAVITDNQEMLQRLLGEDLHLTLALERDARHVKIDPTQLSQVLLNLAVNARDAMPRGGTLTIATSDNSRAHSSAAFPPGPSVLLSIADTGCGMSADVKSHIFEPFFTTKDVGKGTGLGLAVVYGIIKQNGGLIAVDSEPDRGTTFHIFFPAVDLPLPPPEAPRPVQNLRGTETILLAEDDPHLRKLAAIALQDYGYTLLQASDGQDALRLLAAVTGPIHLLATDVIMPHLGGRELAAALRPHFPHMKVLFISGYTDDAVLRRGIQQSDFAFLPKPYTLNGLRLKVRQVLDQH